MSKIFQKTIFDTIHGNINLTRAESRILESAYYQRLRWIKQLGFSFYIYPGATHTRFAHALGVMHTMDKVLHSTGVGVSEERLYNPAINDERTIFHRTMRLAAMLHDIGTFPFSHTIELGYINHWKKQRQHGKKLPMANHENLGIHIILNTDFPGGVTRILQEEGIDPKHLSEIITGQSPHLLANQLLHSDIDVDRMDYLIRDAYHTGVNLGLFDFDFLIRNLTIANTQHGDMLCVKADAMSVAEYFLICRYSWYSQVINDGTGYKFDLIAAKIYEYFLENGMAYSFEQLVREVSQDPLDYFTFNDSYFLAKLHEYLAGRITHPVIRELSQMLAMRVAPKQIKIAPFDSTLVRSEEHRQELIKEVTEAAAWLEAELKKIDPKSWIIIDIPTSDVMFTKNPDLIRKNEKANGMINRDSVRVLTRHNEPKLLVEVSNSLMKILSQYRNFIPRIYVSDDTYQLLQKHGILEALGSQKFKKAG